jgi:hypothetical protein
MMPAWLMREIQTGRHTQVLLMLLPLAQCEHLSNASAIACQTPHVATTATKQSKAQINDMALCTQQMTPTGSNAGIIHQRSI